MEAMKNLNQNPVKRRKSTTTNHRWTKLKFMGEEFEVGDSILVSESGGSPWVARLNKILGLGIDKSFPECGMVEVKWFYSRKDFDPEFFKGNMSVVGENELFESDHKDRIFIESILGKCKVLQLEDYLREGGLSLPNIFLCRARYDTKSREFKPSIDRWEKICHCKTVFNPNREWIACSSCMEYFHRDHFMVNTCREEGRFKCTKCRNKRAV